MANFGLVLYIYSLCRLYEKCKVMTSAINKKECIIMEPLDNINNVKRRTQRKIQFRSYTSMAKFKMRESLTNKLTRL